MEKSARAEVTRLLEEQAGDSADQLGEVLLPLLYDELRALAAHALRSEPVDLTLQPTALVHEAYVKLVAQHAATWRNRKQFLAIAAQAMRRILVDQARARRAEKRGRSWEQVTLSTVDEPSNEQNADMIAIDEALTELTALNERQSRVVELRFFAGLTVEQVAEVLEVSRSTVEAEWRVARAWLASRLGGAQTS